MGDLVAALGNAASEEAAALGVPSRLLDCWILKLPPEAAAARARRGPAASGAAAGAAAAAAADADAAGSPEKRHAAWLALLPAEHAAFLPAPAALLETWLRALDELPAARVAAGAAAAAVIALNIRRGGGAGGAAAGGGGSSSEQEGSGGGDSEEERQQQEAHLARSADELTELAGWLRARELAAAMDAADRQQAFAAEAEAQPGGIGSGGGGGSGGSGSGGSGGGGGNSSSGGVGGGRGRVAVALLRTAAAAAGAAALEEDAAGNAMPMVAGEALAALADAWEAAAAGAPAVERDAAGLDESLLPATASARDAAARHARALGLSESDSAAVAAAAQAAVSASVLRALCVRFVMRQHERGGAAWRHLAPSQMLALLAEADAAREATAAFARAAAKAQVGGGGAGSRRAQRRAAEELSRLDLAARGKVLCLAARANAFDRACGDYNAAAAAAADSAARGSRSGSTGADSTGVGGAAESPAPLASLLGATPGDAWRDADARTMLPDSRAATEAVGAALLDIAAARLRASGLRAAALGLGAAARRSAAAASERAILLMTEDQHWRRARAASERLAGLLCAPRPLTRALDGAAAWAAGAWAANAVAARRAERAVRREPPAPLKERQAGASQNARNPVLRLL